MPHPHSNRTRLLPQPQLHIKIHTQHQDPPTNLRTTLTASMSTLAIANLLPKRGKNMRKRREPLPTN